MKLNLGCGDLALPGYVNYDFYPMNESVKFIDINKMPLPFEDASADEILLSQVLEHLNVSPYDVVNECFRILKKDGILKIGLPAFSFSLEHMRGYHPVGYMTPVTTDDIRMPYQIAHFKINNIKYKFKLRFLFRRIYELALAMGTDRIEWELKK